MKNITEIGIPFYNDINEQLRNKPFYNASIVDWLFPANQIPPFQFYGYEGATGLVSLDIVNVDTAATTDILSTFTTYGSVTDVGDIDKYYTYDSTQTITLPNGRYYIYAKDDLDFEWWSEVFVVRDSIFKLTGVNDDDFIEIGLPFFNDIDKQVVNKPYYNADLSKWLCAENRLPPFQFKLPEIFDPTIVTFNLVNYDTGAETDILLYFNQYVAYTDRSDNGHYYTHLGIDNLGLSLGGRYYLYAESTEGLQWWSEVFYVCGNITETEDFLLLDKTDVLLLDASDKLKIG